jgi:hypothetical protein
VGKPDKRKPRRAMTVEEAEAALERARRREAAREADRRGPGNFPFPEVSRAVPRVDLANLDTPEVSHADQWAAFLNRPGRFYVATLEIPADDDLMGLKVASRATLKADDQQLPYLVEVLRQVRGAFGEHCRITLTPADVVSAETGRAAGPAVTRHDDPERGAALLAAQRRAQAATEGTRREARRLADEMNRDATPEELEAVRAMRRVQAERIAEALPTVPDGPPHVPGVDVHLGERVDPTKPPRPPWEAVSDREFTKEELLEMLPGQTRAEVAAEAGKAPEDLGGTVQSDELPETIAAELGVPLESLTRVAMHGGGYAWAVVPTAAPTAGRHAAADVLEGQGPHGINETTITEGDGETVKCNCGLLFRDEPGGLLARTAHAEHRDRMGGKP